ncbi:MAG TPA: substrate-binding domain-containing protein [Nitrospirales bacterium]|nr:substrate-binding domain-containing protein [Nitrospirales bacterium]
MRAALRWLVIGVVAVMPLACGKGSSSSGKKFQIAVIPKGTTHEYWKSIHAGAVKAERELKGEGLDVNIIWKGPIREDDREQQIQVVEGFLSQGVNGIVLAPLDSKALVRPVEEAKNASIPTVIFDSALDSKNIVSFVATDNEKGGRLAAEHLGKILGGKGRVLMLRYQEGSASTEARESGFLDGMKKSYPTITIVSSDQYAGPTRDTAKRAAENLLNRFGSNIDGIFCPNESAAAGMLLALQDGGLAGKVKFVGFDSSSVFLDAMKAKQMDGFVLQNPFEMGHIAVKTMVDYLQGKQVPPVIDTGVSIVTPDNMDTAEVKKLLNPPLAEYLQ